MMVIMCKRFVKREYVSVSEHQSFRASIIFLSNSEFQIPKKKKKDTGKFVHIREHGLADSIYNIRLFIVS